MTPELCEILGRVQEELGAQIDLLDREGCGYAKRYLEAITSRDSTGTPRPPVTMHPALGKMIREHVLDELAVAHRLPVSAGSKR